MAILSVGHDAAYSSLASAVAAAHDGDVVELRPGTYTDDFAVITVGITIRGVDGMANLVATREPPNGKAILVTHGKITLEHLAFSGAKAAAGNGAGIRYEGGDLAIRDCWFHDNQEGLLSAPDPQGTITIERSEFAHNGSGDGYTHNLYVGAIGTLTVEGSYFHDAVVGHEIKSRAYRTVIRQNRIVDGPLGTASYNIDLPNGGAALVAGNVIEQGPRTENPAIIHFGGETPTPYGNSRLEIRGNTILNDLHSVTAVGLFNQTPVAAVISDNRFFGLDRERISRGPSVQSGNIFLSHEPVPDTTSPWVFPASVATPQR